MQMIAPILGSLGAGGAAAGAAAAGTAAAAASTSSLIGTLSTVVGVGSSLLQMSYQNRVANNAARIMEENAQRALHRGQEDQQQQDLDAAEQMAQVTAAQAQSGFSLSSPTFRRAEARNRMLARRDATRIREAASLEAQGNLAQAEQIRSEKKPLGLALLSGLLDVKSSMISGASLVRKAKAGQQDINTRGYPA